MSKQVVVLDISQVDQFNLNVRYLLWVTTTKPIPKPSISSQWTGASASEVTALQAGTTVEFQRTRPFPPSATKAQIQAILQADYAAAQAASDAATPSGQFYGVFFDSSTGWSA